MKSKPERKRPPNREKKSTNRKATKPLTLLHGLDLGAGAARGVDGLLILLGGGGGCFLPHHHRLPVLPDRPDPGHRPLPPSQSLTLRSLHGSLSQVSPTSLSLSQDATQGRRSGGGGGPRRRYGSGRGTFWSPNQGAAGDNYVRDGNRHDRWDRTCWDPHVSDVFFADVGVPYIFSPTQWKDTGPLFLCLDKARACHSCHHV